MGEEVMEKGKKRIVEVENKKCGKEREGSEVPHLR